MTSIRDQADGADGPEVIISASLDDAEPAYIASEDLVDCGDLTAEDQFPQYGDFLEMRREGDGETVYWECSVAMADVLVNAVEASEDEHELIGTRVDVDFAAKAPSGEWRYSLEIEPETELMDSNDDD